MAAAAAIVVGSSCTGGGCGGCGMEPIPGGFPAAQRHANAVQVRVTSSGFDAIEANPAALIGGIGGGGGAPGVIKFNAPVSCGGDPATCCPNGQPQDPCGPIDIDLNKVGNESDRLVVTPAQGASRVDITMRARVKTESDIPVTAFGADCGIKIDTTKNCTAATPQNPDPSNACHLRVDVPVGFALDNRNVGGQVVNTTKVNVGDIAISNLDDNDVTLTGGFFCQFANFALPFAIDLLKDQLTGPIKDAITGQTCKQCPSGNVSDCGPFADACTDNTCMAGNECLQELGLTGRARGGAVLGNLSPGTTGAIDLYEVAGGYATTNTGGVALGLLGGMQPGGAARDRCGPMATAPTIAPIGVSPFFQGNTLPAATNTLPQNTPFDVGFGVHKSQLAEFAYAGYDGGFLCLTISSATISQLSTDTLSLLSRSLGNLNSGNAPMAVGLRPQSPPNIVLGKNTFMDDGNGGQTLVEPLLDITFQGMEIDFFAAVDDQYVRVMTVVTDVHFPIGLQVTGMGELQPVIADVDDAFTNLSVKNSEALTESPQELADLFPSILSLVIPQLSGGLSPIALPELGGLQLSVLDVTAVPEQPGGTGNDFLAIFANLQVAAMQKPVHTTATIGDVYHPPTEIARHPSRWKTARQPTVQLHLGGGQGLEWSWRIDQGTWSPWTKNANPTLKSQAFWLPGQHQIEVRAREIGKPETIDLTPVSLTVELGANAGIRRLPFHGSPGSNAGCNCDASNNPLAALPFALLMIALLLPLRRARHFVRRGVRRMRRIPAIIWLAAVACLPGCSCGSDYCGDSDCISGDLDHGGLGRWTSIGADDKRVLVATYDQGLGDLVVADVTSPDAIHLVVADGIPTDVTPTHEEDSYRKGIEEPGPDVGAWTSIQVVAGLGRASYQDRDAGALKFAFETKKDRWSSYVLDPGNGEEVGRYTSLAIDADGHPAIAYIALGIDDGGGHRVTELRLARAGAQDPKVNEWNAATIASANGTCGGLCGGGEACVADMDGGQSCAAVTSDCTATCGDTEACVAGSCVEAFGEPTVSDIATGTGLFVDLVVLPDGRLAAVYYNRNTRTLDIAVENSPGANAFTETVLDGGGTTDRGMWCSAVVDGAGTVHIAYQDALGDQLFYTTFNGAAGTPEVVDDGTRSGETRTHNVGAASAIFLVGGAPQIAYQDGLTADVYVATKSGATWSTSAVSAGPLLDGFSIGATTGFGTPYLAWDRLDPSLSPPNGLFVQTR